MIHHAYITLAALSRPTRVHAGPSVPGWTRLQTSDPAWTTWAYDDAGATRTAHLFVSFAVDDHGADRRPSP